jgi:hypothetical protein
MFWNFGVLCLVDLMKAVEAASKRSNAESTQMQEVAVKALVQIARRIAETPSTTVRCEGGSEINLPMLGYHANTRFVIATLKKTVEHLVYLARKELNYGTQVDETTPTGIVTADCDWIISIQPVVKSLLSLEIFDVWRKEVRESLTDLIRKYGDYIMQSWISVRT